MPDSRPASDTAPDRRRLMRWLALAGVAVLFAASFAFAPVRGLATEVLQVFRIQKVQTISFDQADLERISSALESGGGHVNLEAMGDAWVDGTLDQREMTLAEAQELFDFSLRLPAIDGTPSVTVQSAATYRFRLHVSKVNEALRSFGATHLLPDSLDGKVFSVRISPILMAEYGDGENRKSVLVGEGHSPELVMPEGVNPLEIRDVLVNLPFLPEDVRSRLASIGDWQHTLLIPTADGTSREVTIDGVSAVIVTPKDETRPGTGVIWNREGVVYGVAGDLTPTEAQQYAKSMIE